MKRLQWLWGAVGVSAFVALVSNFGLKALNNHAEAELITREARGGVTGIVAGLVLAAVGTSAAKKSVSGWRGKIFSAAKKNRG